MTDLIHTAVLVLALAYFPAQLPWILVGSTVAYGIAKARAEAFERENGWRRFVVSK